MRDIVQLPHPIKVIVPTGPCPTMIVSRPDEDEDATLPEEMHLSGFSLI